jgi:hypothetical protein
MTKNMSAADKEGSAAAQAFASLGIATQNANGELRPQAEMFRESLMALSSMENQSERSALAFKIFGKGAQELFPILDAGTSEINRLTFEADKLGIVMGGKQVQALDNLGDTVDRLKLSFKGTTNQIISALAPSLQNIFANLSRNMPKIQETAKAIFGNLASSLSNILPKLIDIANKIMPTITSIMSNVSNVLGPAVLNVLGDLSDIVANVFNFINENWTFIEPIVWGIVGAITAWNLATKAAMIIEALSKAWAFASTVIGMLQAGTSLATVAQWAFNAAMAANPIGIIIVAIGALIAAIVLVAKNWDEIVKFIVGIWENNIVPFFNSIGDWFSNL